MTFDRLMYIDRLKIAGIDEEVARAHAEALRDALADTVATKADLQELGRLTRADIQEHAAATKADLQELGRLNKADLQEIERKFDTRFIELDRKIDTVAAAAKADLRELDRKIELGLRDVVIKGAGGMVVLASLMIGLKLFG